jgi:glycosyltransferase involved in cell wall biosynthesis
VTKIKCTVVVCTHRRFKLLEDCLDSLITQTASDSMFEVIVVDNDSFPNEEVKKIVSSKSDCVNITYYHENKLGLAQARNTGGKMAKSDYVAYIDDDAKAPPDYVEKALEIIEKIKPDYFGGPYFPYYISDKPKWFRDEYESGITALSSKYLLPGEYLNGTNMIYKKTLLEELNWFDTTFGMTGNKIAYGEETDLQIKAFEKIKNLKGYYSRDLFVYHLVPPIKLKLSDRLKRKYKNGKSQAYLGLSADKALQNQKKSPYILIKMILFFFIKGIPGIFLRNRKLYPFWQNYIYEEIARYFAGVGQEFTYTKKLLFK